MPRHTVLHIGDAHINSAHRRNADRLAALDQIVGHAQRLAEAEALAAIIWPGDLFDRESTAADRNAVAPLLQRLAYYAPVVVVRGNHDAEGDLEILGRLRTNWPVTIATEPGCYIVRGPSDVILACFALPYPFKAGLVGAGVDHAQLGQTAEALLEPLFIDMAAKLEQARDMGYLPIMATHINVGGAVASTGQPSIGRELELTPALLARIQAGIAILGNHIHRHQQIHGLVYAGSIARMDFGENEDKGVLEWTFDTAARAWSWRFVPLDVPHQIHIDGELTRDGFRFDRDPIIHLDCDTRVRYRFLQADAGVLDFDSLKKIFAGARSLKLEGVPTLEHSVRAPEIAAAVTLEGKVEAYCQRHGMAWSTGLQAKLTALQQREHDQLVSDVNAILTNVTAPGQAREQAVA
jgi:hypothetical protein